MADRFNFGGGPGASNAGCGSFPEPFTAADSGLVTEPGASLVEDRTSVLKPFCAGGWGTCDICVGSCGIEEYEAELKAALDVADGEEAE